MHLREKDKIVRKKNVDSVKRDFFGEEQLFVGVTSHERVPNSWGSQRRLTKENTGNSALGGRWFWSNWQISRP